MKTKSTKLKPCPFCGNDKDAANWDNITPIGIFTFCDDIEGIRYAIFCQKCNTFGPTTNTKAKAIKKWNTRAEMKS